MTFWLQWVSGFLMLCGLGFWVLVLFAPGTPDHLAEGGRWLEWRLFPHDMGQVLLRGLLWSFLLQGVVFGLLPGVRGAPAFFQVALTLVVYQGFLVWVVYAHLRRRRVPEDRVMGVGHGFAVEDMAWGLVGYCMVLPLVWLTLLLTKGFYQFMGWNLELQPMVQSIQVEDAPGQSLALFLLIGFVGPFLEEVLFRGVLFPVLARKIGLWPGLAGQAAIFAWIHLHAASAPALFLLGAILGLQYVHTRRLMTCVWTHALFNMMTLLYTLPLFSGGEGLP